MAKCPGFIHVNARHSIKFLSYIFAAENVFMTITPMNIKPIPNIVGIFSFSSNSCQPTNVIKEIPIPDHTAYTTPTGIDFSVNERQ